MPGYGTPWRRIEPTPIESQCWSVTRPDGSTSTRFARGRWDHHDIVEANDGKDSVVPALSREANLPETVKPLLRYSVAW